MRTAAEWKELYLQPGFHEKYRYEGHDLGACCSAAGTRFLLWSPVAEAVTLCLYRDGDCSPAYRKIRMQRRERGVWSWETEDPLHGVYYDYRLIIEGEAVRSADPCAKACGVNGRRSMVVDLARTEPEGWDADRAPEQPAESVIYELHVKEFSWDENGGFPEAYRGTYLAFLCEDTTLAGDGEHVTGCAYLRELGVTHLQLMPVYDFGSVDEAGPRDGFNWGYDPLNYNVPEGSYSTDAFHGEVRIRELREMIQSLHRQGFRVIMDVVYNHTYSLDSWFQRTVPWYYYRLEDSGAPSDGSGCGNDVACERPMCADYILDSVLYWAREYHMDGFRFDLMGLLTTDLMNRIQAALDAEFGPGEKLVYGEPWAAGATAMENGAKGALKENFGMLDEKIGMFCDDTRDAIKGSVFEKKEPGFVSGAEGLAGRLLNGVRAWCGDKRAVVKSPAQILTYVSAHDNQTLWDKLAETIPPDRRACADADSAGPAGEGKNVFLSGTGEFTGGEWRMQANRLAAAVYMTCQGRIFLLSGEEFARTKEGLCDSYNAPVELNRLDWTRAWKQRELVKYYQGLIALRKQLPGLCDKTSRAWKRISGAWGTDRTVGFFVDNSGEYPSRWRKLYIIYNSRPQGIAVCVPEGRWEVLVDFRSSFLWKAPRQVKGEVCVPPVSALVLGQVLAPSVML